MLLIGRRLAAGLYDRVTCSIMQYSYYISRYFFKFIPVAMKYFTNRQVTELYAVSYDAVRKWIQSAQDGKVQLQIGQSESGKWQIADTAKNAETIKFLVERAQKHKNSKAAQTIKPSPVFYTLYNRQEQIDIISSLETQREIPLQYGYYDGGADHWDRYMNRLLNEDNANSLKNTIELIDTNLSNIDRLVHGRRVNVIDLGVGNAVPIKGLLLHLVNKGSLSRYVGIDISEDMLKVARSHIEEWFGDKIHIETYARDITKEGFRDLVASDYLLPADKRPLNLVLFLGGTLLNLKYPEHALRLANSSMTPGDLFMCTHKLDAPNTRRYFDFNADGEPTMLSEHHKLMVDVIGIKPGMYEVEQLYDDEIKSRIVRLRMKIDISIEFIFERQRRLVEFRKNDTIVVMRIKHLTASDTFSQFSQCDFELLESSSTPAQDYLFTITKILQRQY